MQKIIYALIFLFLIFCVTDYNSRVEEQYTFADERAKHDFLESMIIDETNSSDAVSLVISELSLLPEDIWKDFFKSNGQIIITHDLPVEEAVGTFSRKTFGTYKIYVSPDYIEYAMLHEIGHYVGYVQHIENDSDFKKCLSERDKVIHGVLNDNQYFMEDGEYFAEIFKLYIHNELDPIEYPKSTACIKEILSDYSGV